MDVCNNVHRRIISMLSPLIKPGNTLKHDYIEKKKSGKEKSDTEETNQVTKRRKRDPSEINIPALPTAMWVWCTNKYLGMVLPVLKVIRDTFVADAEPRNKILRETTNEEDKLVRRKRLKDLLPWQREVPDSFDILPQKPRAVNFVSVSKTVASSLCKDIKTKLDGPFWWKEILKLDDDRDHLWSQIANADPECDRDTLIRIIQRGSHNGQPKQFRRNRSGKGNSVSKHELQKDPSRIPSLATSEAHLKALKRLQIPPLIVGGFKTNGYELHLEVMTLKEGNKDCPDPFRSRIDGFDF